MSEQLHGVATTRPKPSLESIPTELKLKIASHLDPRLPNHLNWSYVARTEYEGRRSAVIALSQVSRSWAAVLENFRWQEIIVTPRATTELFDFVRTTLPGIARFIKKITFENWAHDWDTWCDPNGAGEVPDTKELAQIERLTKLPAAPSTMSDAFRLLRARNALVGKVIATCTRANSIEIIGSLRMDYLESYDGAISEQLVALKNRAEIALRHAGKRFSTVRLVIDDTSLTDDDQDFGDFNYLGCFRKVQNLTLETNDVERADEYLMHNENLLDLAETLLYLPSLHTLKLVRSEWLIDLLEEAALPEKVTHLILEEMYIAAPYLAAILADWPADISHLTLVDVDSHRQTSELDAPFHLPDLKYLSIASSAPPSLLGLFRASPLSHVELCVDPAPYQPYIKPDRVVRFAERHKETLTSLKIHDCVFGGHEKAGAIEAWSARHPKITVQIMPPPPVPFLLINPEDILWLEVDDEAPAGSVTHGGPSWLADEVERFEL
ncbi:hypothetical protein JCM10908_000058 [Rhodotorula pacifica]|uniref:uncharacterized protein n=1 Tax=Rhodotorula pacifica TaxID=1495444 RepID=UPI0031736251